MRLWKSLFNLIMMILVIMGCILTVPKIFGIQPLMVLSGSMEPYIKTGAIVYTNTNDTNAEIGDVITYRIRDEHVTHRVIDMDGGFYITKGDNNDGVDAEPVSMSQISGKVMFSIPYIGYAANWMRTKHGMIFLFIFICIVIIMDTTDDNHNNNAKTKQKYYSIKDSKRPDNLKIRSY